MTKKTILKTTKPVTATKLTPASADGVMPIPSAKSAVVSSKPVDAKMTSEPIKLEHLGMTTGEAVIAMKYYNQGLLDGHEDGFKSATEIAEDNKIDAHFYAWLKGVGIGLSVAVVGYLCGLYF